MTTTTRGFGMGLVPDDLDERDHKFQVPEAVPYKFVDLEKDPATPPIWNQGQLGSCTAHGSLAVFLFIAAKLGLLIPMLSRLQLYYNSRNIEGSVSEDSGAMIRDAVKACALGIAPETDWPYDVSKFADAPPAVAIQDAKNNVALKYERVSNVGSGIQASLSAEHPVVIGVTLYPSFEADDAIKSGIVPLPTKSEKTIGGHCMAAWGIGYGRDWKAAGQFLSAEDDVLYVKIRNSWGTDVYQEGYLLVPASFLETYGSDFWVISLVS